MAVFRESSGDSGRAAEDRRRHRQLVEESIKKNVGKIISEESIIGHSGNKKIKIPIRGLKEYQFIYGKNQPGVGSGTGDEQRGDRLGEGWGKQVKGLGPTAGNEPGEDIYETEITLDELIEYLFDDLNLPDMERRKLAELKTVANRKVKGYQRKGPPPRLAKKKSVVEKLKRRQNYKRVQAEEIIDEEDAGRFPFREEDLRYRRMRETVKPESNAVVICIMDTSGSMDQTKKYLARSFYYLLYQFIRLKYVYVEVVFIAHSTEAKEVTEEEFFHKAESGGTYISSGYQKALEIIAERYPPKDWNIYAFHCSDGDNWEEDNSKAVELATQLCKTCNLFGYGEIMTSYSTIRRLYMEAIHEPNFALVTIDDREDVWLALRGMLDREGRHE
ncbi:MAG TPA: sporulation protein YhbH [Bacillota bacterium]|nr:sporulation protein YhbH [Bacillota bacterium]